MLEFERAIRVLRPRVQLDWPWSSTNVYGRFRRLSSEELAHEWGEAAWTASDLWRPGSSS